jgi:hypothetical protein
MVAQLAPAQARRLSPQQAKKMESAIARAAERKARVIAPTVLAAAPVPTEAAREELPVNPYASTEHVETVRMGAMMPLAPNPVTAMLKLYDPEHGGTKDYLHPDEKGCLQLLADRRSLASWLPPSPKLTMKECHEAALRAQAGQAHRKAYGPTVTRLARVDTANGARVEKAFYGRLSAVQQALPDQETRELLEAARVTGSRGYTPVRMDLYPTA